MVAAANIPRWVRPLAMLAMVMLGGLLLCLPAFWNGFPLMYSDTGAYLATAFEGKLPMARPTGYGLFIRYSSLGGHLRLVLLIQGLLLSGLVARAIRVAVPNGNLLVLFPATMVLALGGTGMAWYSSQLMPDFMTGLVVIAFFLLLYDEAAGWWGCVGYAFLAFWFCFSHYSHTALLLGLAGSSLLLWLAMALRRRAQMAMLLRILWAAVPALVAIFAYCYVNYVNDLGWRSTRSSHVFTMARLSETGLLKDYLHETCPEHNWRLCPYADSLPSSAADFIWRDDSPFKKTGYWDDSRAEYEAMLSDFWGKGHFLRRYAVEALKAGSFQMLSLRVGEGLTPYNESSSPYKFFERRMPEKLEAYRKAKQFDKVFDFELETTLLSGWVVLSFVLIAGIVVWRGRRLDGKVVASCMLLVVTYVLNAFITGAFANVYSRLQSRAAWLIPFALILLVADIFGKMSKRV